jgi:hypothetical protein
MLWQELGKMPADTAPIEARSAADPPTKAAGKMRLLSLDRLDGRTIACRRARQLVERIEADLNLAGGLSEGTKQLIQRAAVLGTFIESCEAQWLAGQEVVLGDYLAAINSQRRVLATIGLERRARDVSTPTLEEIAAEIEAEEAAGT